MENSRSENVQVPSSQKLTKEIRGIIKGARKHEYLVYKDVDVETGFTVATSLNEDGEVENVAHM